MQWNFISFKRLVLNAKAQNSHTAGISSTLVMDEDNSEVFHTVRSLLVNLRHKHDLHRTVANPVVYQKGIRTHNPAWIN
jgi:hypothetical protein